MTTLQSSSLFFSTPASRTRAVLNVPKFRAVPLSIPKLPTKNLIEELNVRVGHKTSTTTTIKGSPNAKPDPMVITKLYAVMEAISDRVEMHNNIGEQRDNWNHLLLTSINMITLSGATMTGLASVTGMGTPLLALKLSSTLMYLAATGMLLVMNKIQPSQLAEEQRNAARLFKQLLGKVKTILAIGNPTMVDVNETMDKVLALDRAYPLPLLGVMLEKFPSRVEPAVWWPQQRSRGDKFGAKIGGNNGWNGELEKEMKEILGVLKRKDKAEYLRLSEVVLKVNKTLAILGPLLTGIATLGSALMGSSSLGSVAAVVGVVAGALASIVNTLHHGGQVGMVFEMYRSTAGCFKLMEATIESNLMERDAERRENGELFELNIALLLGRSLFELKELGTSSISASQKEDTEAFASKLM